MPSSSIVIYLIIISAVIDVINSNRVRAMNKRKSRSVSIRQASGWSRWSRWDCPVTCGGGTAERVRICSGRGSCVGPNREMQPCADFPCPVGAPQYLVDAAQTQIQSTSRSYQVKKGEQVTLNCMGSLRGTIQNIYFNAKVVWYHNEEVFHHDKGRTGLIDESKDLVFAKTAPKDNGVWACQVRLDERSQVFTSVYSIAVENDRPDVEIAEGDPFELPCNNNGLMRFFNSRLFARWYHNTNPVELTGSDDAQDLIRPTSSMTDAGVWTCKVRELDAAHPKEWATNVILVKVLPTKSSSLSKSSVVLSSKASSSMSGSPSANLKVSGGKNGFAIVVVLVVTVIVGTVTCFCWRRRKKTKKRKQDVEKGYKQRRKLPAEKSKKRKSKEDKRLLKSPKSKRDKSLDRKKFSKREKTKTRDKKKSHKKKLLEDERIRKVKRKFQDTDDQSDDEQTRKIISDKSLKKKTKKGSRQPSSKKR